MKKLIYILIFLAFASLANAQWQTDVQLTDASGHSWTTYNNVWNIASNGNILHVVWYDMRDGNTEIYHKRSTDAGITWGSDNRLTVNASDSKNCAVAVSGSFVHVVWREARDSHYEIYYKRSTDGGLSWGADTRLTFNSSWSYEPCIAVSGQTIHVTWYMNKDGNNLEIYYMRSPDQGASWGPETRLTTDSATQDVSSVAASDLNVHIVWRDERDGNSEIYYKRSTDGGLSWGLDTRLSNNYNYSGFPCITISGSAVHVVWHDDRDGNKEIYYKRSTDYGLNWESDTRLTNNNSLSEYPNILSFGSNVHLLWQDDRDGNSEIYYKHSTTGGNSWEADTRLTNNSAVSGFPSVSISGSSVQVVWHDYRNGSGNAEIYFKRNPIGNVITGIQNISTEIPSAFSLSQNYPNPFNPSTYIKFDISKNSFVSLKVFDALGREVAVLVNEQMKPGTYEADWNASNYPSGVYFYTMRTEGYTETKRMMLVK